MLQTCWCRVACGPGKVVRLAQHASSRLPSLFPKFLPTPLVRPQPVVTHLRPSGSPSLEEGRQTGEIRAVYWTGEASFRRVTSLFRVLGFQLGWVMAYGARREPWGSWSMCKYPRLAPRGRSRRAGVSVSKANRLKPIVLCTCAARDLPSRWSALAQARHWKIGHILPKQLSVVQHCKDNGSG